MQKLFWWLAVSLSTILGAFAAVQYDLVTYIHTTDSTFISFFIIGLYLVTTAQIGYVVNTTEKPWNFRFGWFVYGESTNLGLLGTLIGLALTFSVFVYGQGLATPPEELNPYIANGIGTAITTTVVGLISAALLKLQLFILETE